MQSRLVPIDSVRVKQKKLKKLHPTKVAQYERDFEQGDEFPPIEVEDCGGFYTIRDGRHRYIAQKNLGYTMIEVVVVRSNAGVLRALSPGTPAPPRLHACRYFFAGHRTGGRFVCATFADKHQIITGLVCAVYKVAGAGVAVNAVANIFGFLTEGHH